MDYQLDDIANDYYQKSINFMEIKNMIFKQKIKRPPRKPKQLDKPKNCTVENIQHYEQNNEVGIITNLFDEITVTDEIQENKNLNECINQDDTEYNQSHSLHSHKLEPKKKKKVRSKCKNNKRILQDLNVESTSQDKECKKEDILLKNKFPEYLSDLNAEEVIKGNTNGENYIVGILRINPRFYKHAFLTMTENDEDLLIDGILDRNRALEGDVVIAIVKPEEEWSKYENGIQKTGRVIYILEKVHSRKVVGTLQFKSNNIFLYPRDPRLPILIIFEDSIPYYVHQNPDIYLDCLFMATIVSWKTVYKAFGRIKRMLGKQDDIETETEAILMENNLSVLPFTESLLKGLPPIDYVPTLDDIKNREDWRQQCIFTIDPETAVDLDDAVSCKLLENGNYEVGVHIADVTYFLEAFSTLDKKIAKRATTVYLTDTVHHMLPKQLCYVCSLLPGCDKLAFSVIWEITSDVKIIKHRFAKTVINSCCQLSYDVAQRMIDGSSTKIDVKVHGNHTVEDIARCVIFLNQLAVQMRKKRFDGGALSINQPKLYIEMDKISGQPISYKVEELNDSKRLIEEFMLLANITVAEQLYEKCPEYALLRSHKQPSPRLLKKSLTLLEQMGIILNANSAGALQSSLNEYQSNGLSDNDSKRYKTMIVNTICSKALSRATYICSKQCSSKDELNHYALNTSLYTHFTSPIRRYADCVVHRLLNASLGINPMSSKWNHTLCSSIAQNCNIKKYSAKLAQEQSCEMYFAYYLQIAESKNTNGIVLEVKESYMDIILCDIGLKVRIFYSDIKKNAVLKYYNDSIPYLKITWTKQNIIQDVNVFTILNLQINKHPEQYRIQANIIPPAL